MSHHLDSPLARQDVRLDISDLYLFRGEQGTALVMNVSHSAGAPPVPGFHPEGRYEFKIDLDGDAVEDLTYRFVFGERDPQQRQSVEVTRIAGASGDESGAQGEVVLRGESETELTGDRGERVWTGAAGDPFWIEPTVLQAVGHAVHDGTTIDLGDWTPAKAQNAFAGATLFSIVLELPDDVLAAAVQGRIGVWALASLQTDAGGWRSINRVGLPMIHPLFAQFDEHLGDELNLGTPAEDPDRFRDLVVARTAGVVGAYGGAQDAAAYAESVADRLLPNVLPYRVGSPASFGFAGWNGRSLTDNAPEVMFSLVADVAVTLGIGTESVSPAARPAFPYLPPLT